MATILFYTPFYRRARDVESLILSFKKDGHEVISLSQREGVELNPYLESQGIKAYSYIIPREGSALFFLRHLIFFIRFSYSKKVDVVFSHLDPANFVASLGQYFIKAKVYLCRHHIDEAALYNYNASLSYRLTNLLAKKIIVVSEASRRYMIEYENVDASKLIHINLAYDFNLYKALNDGDVKSIRDKFNCRLLLITVCRLTKFKRPEISISVLKKLIDSNVDAQLLLLGSGDMQEELTMCIKLNGLEDRVFLLGHVHNVLDYLAAADFVLHPSVLESSCVVIKEAGIVRKAVIVCKGVGDFDEYITNNQNGFMVSKDNFSTEAANIILNNYEYVDSNRNMGDNLHNSVSHLFNINTIASKYHELL